MARKAKMSLLKVNVNDKTEKKGQLTYLSWAWAWAEVLKFDPLATWVVHTYGPQGAEQPCMWIGETAMVHTSVTVAGIRRECMLPVMDNKNNAVKNPDSRKISDAIMRCMTKAISMHGLGLYIYAGEDLPEGDEAPQKPASPIPASFRSTSTDGPIDVPEDRKTIIQLAASLAVQRFKKGEKFEAFDEVSGITDSEEKLYLWQLLKAESALRAFINKERAEGLRRSAAAGKYAGEEPALISSAEYANN